MKAQAVSPDGTVGVVVDGAALKILDLETGKEKKLIKVPGGYDCLCIAPDNRRIAHSDLAGVVTLYDANTGKPTGTIPNKPAAKRDRPPKGRPKQPPGDIRSISHLTFSPDGRLLAVSATGATELWLLPETETPGDKAAAPSAKM